MQIDGISTISPRPYVSALAPALPMARALRAENGMKADLLGPEPGASPPMAATPQALGTLQVVVAASSLGAVDEKRRVQLGVAKKGLDSLDRLHREMLSGTASKATLTHLQDWLRDKPESKDPKLSAFFAEIELRVRVELAKFDLEA